VQLKKDNEFWTRRKAISEIYDKAFRDVPEITPIKAESYVKPSYHLYIIKVNTDLLTVGRDTIMNAIQAENVGIGIHFRVLHLMEGYRQYGYKRGDLPAAEYASDRIISLPLYPALSEEDVQDVITAVKKVIAGYRR
jgi:perosamine synthetase